MKGVLTQNKAEILIQTLHSNFTLFILLKVDKIGLLTCRTTKRVYVDVLLRFIDEGTFRINLGTLI